MYQTKQFVTVERDMHENRGHGNPTASTGIRRVWKPMLWGSSGNANNVTGFLQYGKNCTKFPQDSAV